jgi:nucleoside-diphosphate kinase
MLQRTLSILKPDITRRQLTGRVNAVIEEAGLRIIAQKRLQLTMSQAQQFYAIHQERSFFKDLCLFMITGPIVAQVLECSDAIQRYRQIMGETNPINAEEGTIRRLFAESIEANSVHGSDSVENAQQEIFFFFSQLEIHP